MTVMWIPGHLLAAPTPAVMAAAIDDASSPVRVKLDALYKAVYASNTQASAGTLTDRGLTPAANKYAFNAWFPTAFRDQPREIAIFRPTAGVTYLEGLQFATDSSNGISWTLSDAASVLYDVTNTWKVVRSGWYRLSANFACGRSNPAQASFTFSMGWAIPGGSSQIANWYGHAERTGAGLVKISSSESPVWLDAGNSIGLVTNASAQRSFTQEHRLFTSIAVERVSP